VQRNAGDKFLAVYRRIKNNNPWNGFEPILGGKDEEEEQLE
jgi:hypothetical protein